MRKKQMPDTGQITDQMVIQIKWKRLTKGLDSLTKREKKILQVWDYTGGKVTRREFNYAATPQAEIKKQIAAGKPPRVLTKVPVGKGF